MTERLVRLVLASTLLLVEAGGCARHRVYESVYEGLKARERIAGPADDGRPAGDDVPYDRYAREREELPNAGKDPAVPQK